MRFYISKKKNKEMARFSEEECAIADNKHFGKRGRWQEYNYYLRAVDKGQILGILHYSLQAGVMEITTVIVLHTNQRKGVGRALMNKAEKIAQKNNAHKLYLKTGKDWDSIKFYEKIGFQQTGELKSHYLKRDWLEFSKFIK